MIEGGEWRPGPKVHLTTADGIVDYWCDASDAEGQMGLGQKVLALVTGDAPEPLVNQTERQPEMDVAHMKALAGAPLTFYHLAEMCEAIWKERGSDRMPHILQTTPKGRDVLGWMFRAEGLEQIKTEFGMLRIEVDESLDREEIRLVSREGEKSEVVGIITGFSRDPRDYGQRESLVNQTGDAVEDVGR